MKHCLNTHSARSMRSSVVIPMLSALALVFALSFLPGCTNVKRLGFASGGKTLNAIPYQFKDGKTSSYYTFTVGDNPRPSTIVFFYGGSGCASWKYVMPAYLDGFTEPARVFVLNKRFVDDRSNGMFGCSKEFHRANNPDQWEADYSEFVSAQLSKASPRPKNVVLVGVSEGAYPAEEVARRLPAVTHLAIIGAGGYSMRTSLATLAQNGIIPYDVDAGWQEITSDPQSLDKHWYGNPYRWWYDIMDVDPMKDLLALNIPILAGIGEKDKSVPVESARFLETEFRKAGKRNLFLHVYSGADHRLIARGKSYRKEYFGELSRLLQSHPGPTGKAGRKSSR